MNIQRGVPGSDQLPPDLRLAVNVERDFQKAVGLYSLGDRCGLVLRTIALGVRAYRAVGWPIPFPIGPDRAEWDRLVEHLAAGGSERDYEVAEPVSSAVFFQE